MEGELVDEAEAFQDPLPPSEESLITTGRIANVVIAAACLFAMISCIVCLAVMAHKHSQVIHNVDPDNSNSQVDKEVCILYATTYDVKFNNGTNKETNPKWNESHTCQFVIFGSSFVAGVLLLVICYYILRLFIMRSINVLIIFELIGFGLLTLVMFAVGIVVSAGRAYTCDRLTHNINRFSKCSDVCVRYDGHGDCSIDPVFIYSALKASEVSAWISFLLLLALVIVSIVKLVIWLMRNSVRRRDERQLDSFIAPENDDNDDDDEPLPM